MTYGLQGHLATKGGRHYAALSICLRRHLLSLDQYATLSYMVNGHCGVDTT